MKQNILGIIAVGFVLATLLGGCKGKNESAEQDQPRNAESNPEAEEAAISCAERWLPFLDREQYEMSWQQLAGFVKQAIPVEQWRNRTRVSRGGLGKLVTRRLKSTQYTGKAPAAPQGRYVTIQYSSNFEKNASVVETVTAALCDDDIWRVSAYSVK